MAREQERIAASSAARTREPDTGGAAAPLTGCGPGRWTHGRPAGGRSPRSGRGAGRRSRPLRPPVGPGQRGRPSPAAGPAPPGRRHAADGSPGGGPPSSRPPCPRRNRPADPTRPSRPRHRARDGKGGSGGPWLAAPHAGRTGRPRRTPDAGAGVPARATPQAESFSRPLRRRPAMIARPARVRIRSRKPWVLDRRRLFGWNVRLLTRYSHYMTSAVARLPADRRAEGNRRGRLLPHPGTPRKLVAAGRPARTDEPCGTPERPTDSDQHSRGIGPAVGPVDPGLPSGARAPADGRRGTP